jgi:threonylcarbamoyladenosine tRNA methylthiotransferase MtaB
VGRFYIQNFGCRATQADGASLERLFENRGWQSASSPDQAQLVVLNTCTVTAAADHDARAVIRRVQRENPKARIVVTGCYAQRAPEELAAMPGVTQVIGNSHKHQLVEIALGAEQSERTLVSDEALQPHDASPTFVPLAALQPSQRPTTHDQRPGSDQRPIFVSDIFAHTELLAAPVFDAANERTRPNLKIQDGCDNRCSFCVIPFVRGQSRSLPLDRILREVNGLVAAGFRELVVSGINLGRWGRDLEWGSQHSALSLQQSDVDDRLPRPESKGDQDFTHSSHLGERLTTNDQRPIPTRRPKTDDRSLFPSLIRAILDHTALERLRISSVEPMDWSDDLIALVAGSPRIAKHAHVPMQSGSDAVLRRMHRKYRPWHYREKIEKIHAAMPAAAIGADVMVGFPGETEAEFEETRSLVEELPFTYLHVFTYSPRPGTTAATMLRQVPVNIARERNRVLRELAAAKKQAFMESFVGQTLSAITLSREGAAQGTTEALTDNYLSLTLDEFLPANQMVAAYISSVEGGKLVGSVQSEVFVGQR